MIKKFERRRKWEEETENNFVVGWGRVAGQKLT